MVIGVGMRLKGEDIGMGAMLFAPGEALQRSANSCSHPEMGQKWLAERPGATASENFTDGGADLKMC